MKIQIDYTTWGDSVRMRRHRLRLTQQYLAEQVGVSQTYISSIEQGDANPTHAVVMSLCALLDIVEPPYETTEGGEV